MATATSATQALKIIADKRKALERLVRIAQSVSHQQKALSQLALSARPSQDFPQVLEKRFHSVEKKFAQTSAEALNEKLDKLEARIEQSIERIIFLARIDINMLRDQQLLDLDLEHFQALIEEFRKRAKSSLALRYILKKRGFNLPPLKLPISQEQIGEEIDHLRDKEKHCVSQVRQEINEIIRDSRQLLTSGQLPTAIQKELKQVVRAMQVNIEHLDAGGSIHQLPNLFETVVLETESTAEPEPQQSRKTGADSETTDTQPAGQAQQQQPRSFLWRLGKWLMSPWKTSWREINQKYGPR